MSNWILAVTDDFSNMKEIKAEGNRRNLQVQYVSTINEAFELLAVKDFELVAIRADNVEYMPKLRVMRELNH